MNDKRFQTKHLKEWNSNDISNWLASIGMKAYITTFKNELITGKQLYNFVEDDLRSKCKITARPIRKILFKRLKHVQGKWKSDDNEIDKKVEVSMKEEPLLEEDLPEEPSPVEENVHPEEEDKSLQRKHKGMSPTHVAAFKIQSLYQCWKGHNIVVRLIKEQYRKRYFVKTGRYIYVYVGRIGPLAPVRYLAVKPINLGSKELPVEFTEGLATMRIQLFARYCFITKQVRKMIRAQWERILDPISGKYFYFHGTSGVKTWKQPKLLGKEKWNPMDMKEWSEEDVKFYFRKLQMGKKRTAMLNELIQKYQIDGDTLLTFDETDLALLGMQLPQRKRLIGEMKSVERNLRFDPKVSRCKRDKFRHNYRILQAAITIQRSFRQYTETKFLKVIDTLKRSKRRNQQIDLSLVDNSHKLWWSNFPLQTIRVYLYHLSHSGENTIFKSLLQTDDSLTLHHYDNVVL